jgi:Domain of unknown function (DUF4868)
MMDETKEDILQHENLPEYKETDIFAWANNLVQYKDELKIDLFLVNRNYILYKTQLGGTIAKQMEPLFIDEILEYVLEGADKGMSVRSFEEAESEEGVLQKTWLGNVDKAREVLNWVKTQEHEIEQFVEEEHDFKRIKGVMARVKHDSFDKPFYVFKVLPPANVMRGKAGWMMRQGKFVPFDADAALRIPPEPQLLILDQDIYVFNQAKLKSMFGYDAKESSIARAKVTEIESHFKLSFEEGVSMNAIVQGKKALIKKLQKLDPTIMKQEELMKAAEELDIDLMQDDSGAIIIMDDKDLSKFVNLLNEDYIESHVTGQRYEIIRKKPLKVTEDDLLREVL